MTDQEITAIARELADYLYNDDESYNSILWWGEEPKERKAEELEHTLRFLLRRYCLVEKEAVRKEYEDSYRQYLAAGNARPLRQQYFFGRCFALEHLFPDLGKEVKP